MNAKLNPIVAALFTAALVGGAAAQTSDTGSRSSNATAQQGSNQSAQSASQRDLQGSPSGSTTYGINPGQSGQAGGQSGGMQQPMGQVTVTTFLLIPQEQFERIDRDGDGQLTREEIRLASEEEQRFQNADRDRSGHLSREELRWYQAHMSPPQSGRAADALQGPPGGATSYGIDTGQARAQSAQGSGDVIGMEQSSGRAASSGREGAASVTTFLLIPESEFMRIDTNRDGRLTREEVSSASQLEQEWQQADRNRDGYLTREELRWYQSQMTPQQDTRGVSGVQSSATQPGTAGGPVLSGPPSGETSYAIEPSRGQTTQREQRITGVQPPGNQQAAPATVTTIILLDEPEFLRLDTDGDNRLSQSEVRTVSRLHETWSAVDTNGDGYLTREELRDYQPRLVHGYSAGNQAQQSGTQQSAGNDGRVLSGPPSGSTRYGINPGTGTQQQ